MILVFKQFNNGENETITYKTVNKEWNSNESGNKQAQSPLKAGQEESPGGGVLHRILGKVGISESWEELANQRGERQMQLLLLVLSCFLDSPKW